MGNGMNEVVHFSGLGGVQCCNITYIPHLLMFFVFSLLLKTLRNSKDETDDSRAVNCGCRRTHRDCSGVLLQAGAETVKRCRAVDRRHPQHNRHAGRALVVINRASGREFKQSTRR